MKITQKIIPFILSGLLLAFSATTSSAKIICCHNYYDWPGPPFSLDKTSYSTSTSTISGSDVYVEINCHGTGSNDCPSCSPAKPVVTGDWGTYKPDDLMNYVYAQLVLKNTSGDIYYQGDPAVRLMWSTDGDNSLTITYTGNDKGDVVAD